MREAAEYRERSKSLEEELHKVKAARSVDDLQRKELEEQLEAEQYFSTLYKTQVRELQGELDEGKDHLSELERECETLRYSLQQSHQRADNEARGRRVAEEDIADLEKEKMMIELEMKEMSSKHKAELRNKDMEIISMKDTESDYIQRYDLLSKDNNELQYKIKELQDELEQMMNINVPPPAPVQMSPIQDVQFELDKMKKMLNNERLLKQQAVNKLAEIMNRKDFNKKDRRAQSNATSAELRKKEKENRRLQQELTTEKDNFNHVVAKYNKDLEDLRASLYEECQARIKLSMELDTKDSELETLQNKLAHMNLDTASLSSGTGDFGDPMGPDGPLMSGEHGGLEGWLQIPSRQNIRRHGWKKLYVIVSSKKIIFFNSEVERQNADPTLIIDLK